MISLFRGIPVRRLLAGGGLFAAAGLVAATSLADPPADTSAPVSSLAHPDGYQAVGYQADGQQADGYQAVSALSTAPPIPAPAERSIATDTLSTLEGVYTEEQARAGKQVYDMECALCHGPREFAGRVFQITWTGQPLSSLFRHISLSMPLDNPGGLPSENYVAVLAYILELNGYPAGERELPDSTDELGEIMMERLPESDTSNAAIRSDASRQTRGPAGAAATTTQHGENRR